MPVFDQDSVKRLKQIIKWHPRGITISDLAKKMEMNRNLLAKYLDILLISGQVEMQVVGTAKVYFLSHRVPISSMLEFSSDLVIILDSKQQIVQVNEPVLRLLNLKKETLIGKHIRETGNPFLGAIPVTIFPNHSDTAPEQTSRMECLLQGKNKYFKVKQLPTVFEDGAHGIIIIIEDITDQIEHQKALELDEAKYRGIVEDQTEFITRLLSDGTLTFVNDAYARYLGKDKEQLLGGYHIPYIDSQDIPSVRKSILSLDAINPVITFECRIHHPSGQSRWNLWTVRALFDENQKPIEYQAVGRDNTEKHEAASRINEYVRDLEFLSRKAQEFVESSPDADIFQVIAQGLFEIIPDSLITVNSIDVTAGTLTVKAVLPDRDQQILRQYIGKDLQGFGFNIGLLPEEQKKGFFSAIKAGKLIQVQENLFDIFFRQIPQDTCDKIKEGLGLGNRLYTIGLARHGIIFGNVSFSLRKGDGVINESIIETFIRQASIILHRKYTEDKLKASEIKYRGIVEDQTEYVTRFLPDGTLTYANDSLCRFFLMDHAELLGRSIFSLSRIPKDDQDSLRLHLLSMDSRNPVRPIEHRVLDSTGNIRWMQWTTRALLDDIGTIIEYQAVGRDITEQKAAEAKIRQYIADIEFLSQKSYEFLELPTDADIYGTIGRGVKTILPNAIIMINSIDPVTNVATTRSLLGDGERNVFSTFIGKEVIGTEVKLPGPDELQTERMAILSRKLTKVPGNLFITMHKSVPEEICAKIEEELNIGDIYTIGVVSQGIILASVVIMLRRGEIITHDDLIKAYLTHASIALLRYRTEKTLKKNEKLYRSVIENIQDVFYRSDKAGTLTMASPSWAQMLGYNSLNDCIGYNIAEKFYFEPQRRKEFLDTVYTNGSVTDYDVILKRKDGSPVHVSTNSHLYYDDAGNLLGIEGIFRDVSERYAAAKKLQERLEQRDFFSRKLQDFIEISPKSDIFHAIGADFHEMLPNTVTAVNSFDPWSKTFMVRALFSKSDHEIINKIMGKEFIGMVVPCIDEELANNVMTGKVYPIRKNHYENIFRPLAPDTFTGIENPLSTANIYSIGLIWQDKLLGTITFALKNGDTLPDSSLIEIFARAASIALHRQSADDALKESEEIFSSFAQYAPLPIAIIAPDGIYRYINKKFTETFGYDLNDFRTGKEWFSLAYPDPVYRKKVINAWVSDIETYKSGVERPRRFTVRCKNGVDREILFRPVTLANKKQVVIYEEIPDEQKTENLQNLLSRIVEAISDAIISEKTDGTILQWNGGAVRLFGYTGEEVLGHNISLIIPQDRQEESLSLRNQIIRGETVINHKTHRLIKDGRIIDVEITLFPITDENGIITGQSTIARKICLEKIEEQHKEGMEHQEILVENRIEEGYPETGKGDTGVPVIKTSVTGNPFHLSNALKKARDYITIIDRTGKCVWANDAFIGAVNSAGGNDLEGKSIALYIAPEFRKIALDSLMEIKKSGNKTVKLMMLSSSGRVPVEANFSAINTEDGDLFGYMAIARNIERDRIEKPKL